MRLDDRDRRPVPDLWPDASIARDGRLFWNELGCQCDNGDQKAHLPRCDWYPRQLCFFGLLAQQGPWYWKFGAGADAWRRVSEMDPPDFAAAFPDDPAVIDQRWWQGERTVQAFLTDFGI